ncbi:MAG: hypothetical protein ABEJ03_00035 [Candidatus Nanohaloarchaea archaeon]
MAGAAPGESEAEAAETTWTSEAIPISTSTSKLIPAALVLLGLVSLSAGTHVDSGGGSFEGASSGDGFSVPQYDSQADLVRNLVAPFLFFSILLHIGIHRALMFTIAGDVDSWMGRNPEYRKEKSRLRKQSLVLSLVITGMLIPTPYFQKVNDLLGIVLGGGTFLIVTLAMLYVLYRVLKDLFFN